MTPLLILVACTDGTVDTSTDTDTASTTDTGPVPTHLVVTTGEGVEQRTLDGDLERTWSWDDIASPCSGDCKPEGVQVDGHGLLTAYSQGQAGGGVLRLKAEGGDLVPDWEIGDLDFPHDAISDPSGLGVMIAETFAARIVWMDPTTGSELAALDETDSAWDYSLPNSLELIADAGRHYLLMSNRGNDLSGGANSAIDGVLVLWDVTDGSAPTMVWQYPESGVVGMPHSPVMERVDGTWVLAYAHTVGVEAGNNSGDGSVGVAITDSLTTRPAYVADGVLPGSMGELETTRGVELSSDGTLYITETASRGGGGRLIRASLPALDLSDKTGEYTEDHAHQDYIELTDAEELADDLRGTFEPRLWAPSY